MFGQYESFDPGMFDPGVYFPDISSFDWSLDLTSDWSADLTPWAQAQAEYGGVLPGGGGATVDVGGGGLPAGIIQTVLGAGTSIAASLLAPKATTPTTIPRSRTTAMAQPSILSTITSSLPLLGIAGLGAYFLLRKKKGK